MMCSLNGLFIITNEILQAKTQKLLASEGQQLAQLNAAEQLTNADTCSGAWQKPPADWGKKGELSAILSPCRHCCLNISSFGVNSGQGHLHRCLYYMLVDLSGVIIMKMIFLCMCSVSMSDPKDCFFFIAAPESYNAESPILPDGNLAMWKAILAQH